MRAWIVASSIVLLTAGTAHAAGFVLWNQSAHSAGRANAFAATANDPSAIYYNPAGITQLDGLQFYLGTHVIFPSSSFETEAGEEIDVDEQVFFTPHAYFTAKLTDLISAGIGFNSPYGLAVEWPAESPGRQIVRDIELRTFFITPVIAVDFSPLGIKGLSLAGGVDLVPASARLERDILVGDEVGKVRFVGDDFGIGGRFGLLYRPHFLEALSIGLMYRLPVDFEFEGNVDFDADEPAVRALLPPDSKGRAELTAPMAWTAAVAYYIIEDLQAEFDLNWVGWYTFEELVLELPGDDVVAERDWESRFAYKFGLEYAPRPWALRAGYGFDPTPVPRRTLDFTLPDVDRHEITLGFGLFLPYQLRADISGWMFIPRERETGARPGEPPIKGTFSDFAWVLGVSVGGELDWPGKTVF